MKIWSNDYFDIMIEVEDDYIQKKYKYLSGLKKQRTNSILRYEEYLFLKELYPLIALIESKTYIPNLIRASSQV